MDDAIFTTHICNKGIFDIRKKAASCSFHFYLGLNHELYIHFSELKEKQIFKDFFVFNPEIFKNLFKLGWPICLTIMAESGMFSFASILMGWIGDVELAAHGISITVFALFFMIPLGISQAGTVIIAKTIGANEFSKLDQAASSVYFLGLGWALLNTFLIIFFGDFIISLFLN